MGIVFFKINKHKKFNYKPVFFDPSKDNDSSFDNNPETEDSADIQRIKSSIKNQWHRPKKNMAKKYPSTTLALIIAVLFALIYLILK